MWRSHSKPEKDKESTGTSGYVERHSHPGSAAFFLLTFEGYIETLAHKEASMQNGLADFL